ncbi:hypothetical protein U1701_18160 [Sphingomonas sp. PB2P19]|uniref:hypothetical protein n=1 Tax=Sphingomonas rhamnosi TaxID=3096156 RepID=UPI002FC8F63D
MPVLATAAYLPMNRDYAPWYAPGRTLPFDYDKLAVTQGGYFARDPATFDGIWHSVRGGRLWQCDDDPHRRRDYFERFEQRLTKQVQTIG